jgi:glycosyltransferase involved in cell wall biosynthesis
MKIGLYLSTLSPKGASQGRFQSAILEGLIRKSVDRHSFFVLSWSVPRGLENSSSLQYITLRKNRRYREIGSSLKRRFALGGLRVGSLLGFQEGRPSTTLRSWLTPEPEYFDQLRELGIRLIWHVTGHHELPTWLPFIKTVWDVNHRLHPEYPEYSYTRYKFEGYEQSLKSLKKAAFVITGTNEGKQQLVSLFGVYEPKIRVIPFPTPPIPDMKDTPMMDLGLEGPYLLYPARFWPHKNHVVAVGALKVLRDKWNLNMNLVFSGADEGNLSYVLNYAQALGVRDQIKYVGEVKVEELFVFYKNALALVYVSATGPDNLPPLEAMSVGCPAIVAEVPGAREQYGDACLFFHPMDEFALAAHIKRLLDDPALCETLRLKGFNRAKKWTVEDYATEVIGLFDEFELIARSWGSSTAVFT